jgi:hypothetical protein
MAITQHANIYNFQTLKFCLKKYYFLNFINATPNCTLIQGKSHIKNVEHIHGCISSAQFFDLLMRNLRVHAPGQQTTA